MNRFFNINTQHGMALFQVLLLSAVISILAIQFTQTAKNQISIANTLSNRAQAVVDMRTAESKLLFSLLTEKPIKKNNSTNPILKKWNFYGEPFKVDEKVEYTIQDQNGLIGLFYYKEQSQLSKELSSIGIANSDILAARIIDWQDADSLRKVNGAEAGDYSSSISPSNLPFQTYQEIEHTEGLINKRWYDIRPFVSIRPQDYVNPKLAPKELLSLIIPANQVAKVIELRDNNQLSNEHFRIITGLVEDEGIYFNVSGLLRVMIKVEVEDIVFTRHLEFYIQPTKLNPYIEYEKTM